MDEGLTRKQANVNDKISAVDSMFRFIGLRDTDIIANQLQDNPPSQKQHIKNAKNFNSRGEIILCPKQIRQNYENALYGFKWYQMPFCRRTIKRKMSFWGPASVVLAWTYGQYYKKRGSPIIDRLPFHFYLKTFAIFLGVTTCYCFAESLLSDEFCDIQSPFYQQNETRLSIAKRIKAQINKKQGGMLREMF